MNCDASKRKGKLSERTGSKTLRQKDFEILGFEFRNLDLAQSHGGLAAEVEEVSQLIRPYLENSHRFSSPLNSLLAKARRAYLKNVTTKEIRQVIGI